MYFPTDDHALVFWPNEVSVSVVPLSSISDPPTAVGQRCHISIGRKTFQAVTMEIGMYTLLLILLYYACRETS